MNLLDTNSKNLELLYKTKNTKLTIYRFFPNKRKLTPKEKIALLSNYSNSKNSKNSNINSKNSKNSKNSNSNSKNSNKSHHRPSKKKNKNRLSKKK